MAAAGEELVSARQAVSTLLPLAVQASGGMRADEDRHDYLARVRQLAVDLWLETSAESETVRRVAELAACRTFPAVLLGVRIEPSTTRAVLTLRSWGPDGDRQEEIRTDRTDDPRGVQTLELARGLVGHRVTVYKLEEAGRSRHLRYRCAKHLVDLGPATTPDPDPAAAAVPGQPPPAGPPGAGGSGAGGSGVGGSGVGRPTAGDAAPSPDPVAPRRTVAAPAAGTPPTAAPPPAPAGVPISQARRELLLAIGGDEEYRAAALHGIMQRAATDAAGTVLNVDLLRMLAARTPGRDTAAGRKILADYRASAPAG